MTDYIRRLDEAAPSPTSRAEAVCRCAYSGAVRDYRCLACRSGFGPDRAHLGEGRWVHPGESPPIATLACWFCGRPAVTVGWGFAVCARREDGAPIEEMCAERARREAG